MHDILKKDIVTVLTRLSEIIKIKNDTDFLELKELSNHVIHNASVFQDEDSVSVAVLIVTSVILKFNWWNKLEETYGESKSEIKIVSPETKAPFLNSDSN